jgi:SAM-dependent methyltransferase
MARLLIWCSGEVIREKLTRLGDDWQVARFTPPFTGTLGNDRLIDVTARLPFADGVFEAVYARRTVEHLAPDEAAAFLREIARITAPGGVIRISVPDTEVLAQTYIEAAERARRAPSAETIRDVHHHRMLLSDQFVRRVPGGELAREMVSGRMPPDTVRGAFGDALGANGEITRGAPPSIRPGLGQRVRERARLFRGRRWVKEPHARREAHLWIYDRASMPKLLSSAGLASVCEVDSRTSGIGEWERWRLDVSDYGPHDFEPSLILEAVKQKEFAHA